MKDNVNISQYSNISTFNYDYVRLLPQEQIGLHSQPTWELNFIIRGNGIRIIGDTQEAFDEGEVVLVPPYVTHCWYFDTGDENVPIENISVQINDEWLKNLSEICHELSETIVKMREIDSGIRYKEKTSAAISKILVAMRRESSQLRISSLIRIFDLLARGYEKESIGKQVVINRDEERRKTIEIYVICNSPARFHLMMSLGTSVFRVRRSADGCSSICTPRFPNMSWASGFASPVICF